MGGREDELPVKQCNQLWAESISKCLSPWALTETGSFVPIAVSFSKSFCVFSIVTFKPELHSPAFAFRPAELKGSKRLFIQF